MPTRKERKENVTQFRRKQILNAARIIIGEKGFEKATTTEIASSAGISEGTIYNYFNSKRDILLELIKEYVFRKVKHSEVRYFDNTNSAITFSNVQEQLRLDFTNIDIITSLLGEIQRDKNFRKKYEKEVLRPAFTILKNLLIKGNKEDRVKKLNYDIAVRLFAGTVLGLTIIYKIEGDSGFLHKIHSDELASEIENILLHGVLQE